MEVGARDNGAAGVGGCGYARQGRLLLERWVMCTSARKKGRKEASVFALALRRASLRR